MSCNPFDYHDILIFLNDLLNSKRKKNPLFSLRAWAKQMGYKSPSGLSLMLAGQRQVNQTLISNIIRTEKMTEDEIKHITILYYKYISGNNSIFLNLLNIKPQNDNEESQ